jgi:hypothetical protein
VFLGDIEESLAQVENSIDDFPARDWHRLVASRIQDVLAMEVAPSAWSTWEGPGIDPTQPMSSNAHAWLTLALARRAPPPQTAQRAG